MRDITLAPIRDKQAGETSYARTSDDDTIPNHDHRCARESTPMDLVTTSLLREFSGEFDLAVLPESKQFEVMAAYLTVKRHYSESFNPSDLVTGGGGDLGIDALAVIVNSILFTDVDDLRQFLMQKLDEVDATFVFIQADRGSFDAAKLGTFAYGVEQFFDETSK